MPFTADTVAAQQVQDCLRTLYSLVHEIEKKRQNSEQGLIAINNYHTHEEELQSINPRALYRTAEIHAEQEEEVLRKALQKVAEIRSIKNERRIQARNAGNKETIRRGTWMKSLLSSAQTLPLYVSHNDEKPPPLCGAIPAEPNYHAKVGDMVAALVKVAEGDGDNWILAEVVSFNPSSNKYEVDDILEEQNQKKRHVLSKKYVVPLPLMRANPETDSHALFPQGTEVMALYPQTTCFYKAIVNKLPENHLDEYEVLFEDFSYTNGYSPPLTVPQRYVIAIKQKLQKQSYNHMSELNRSAALD